MSTPNLLSLSRIPLGVFGLWTLLQGRMVLLLVILLAATATDFLDGFLARKWGKVSSFGASLDSFSDQILEGLLVLGFFSEGHIPIYFTVLVILRCLLQMFSLPMLSRWLPFHFFPMGRKRIRLTSTMTMVILFLLVGQVLFVREAPPVSEGLHQIILPFIFFPLGALLELMNISTLLRLISKSVKKG